MTGPITSSGEAHCFRALTAIGRATVKLLAINHPDYVLLRESLIDEGTFPET